MDGSRLIDGLCLLLAAGVVGLAYVKRNQPEPLPTAVLLDRPRLEVSEPDFLTQFLEVTQTPFSFQDEYIVLEGTPHIQRRLLQLLHGLETSLAVNAENQRRGSQGTGTAPLVCLPQPDGQVEILPNTAASARPAQFEKERTELQRQYAVIAATLKQLRPGAILPESPFVPSLPTAPEKAEPIVQDGSTNSKVTSESQTIPIELTEVETADMQ